MILGQQEMTNEEYHSSDGVSKTKLDMFAKGEGNINWMKNCPVDNDKLKTLDFGDAAHAIVLEPDRLETDFLVMPELNLRTNDGKAERDEIVAGAGHRKIITADEHKKLLLIRDSVFAHDGCKKLLTMQGAAEESWFWEDRETGLLCKCRPDRNIHHTRLLLDAKTTELLSKFNFSVEDYRYDVQAPWYTDGITECGQEKETMVFLVIQKTIELGRYPVALVTLPQEAVEHGRKAYRQNLRDYAEAQARGFSRTISELKMHNRYLRKIRMSDMDSF